MRLLIALTFFAVSWTAHAGDYVNSYFRDDGTYVNGYYRNSPGQGPSMESQVITPPPIPTNLGPALNTTPGMYVPSTNGQVPYQTE